MVVREFGQGKGETILLLHGGGLSWWNYGEAARLLATDYHVVLPVLDGHAGSDRPFTSIRDNAEEVIDYGNRRFARLQFRFLRIREALFEDYYRDTCRIAKADMIAFMKANTAYAADPAMAYTTARVHVVAGARETREILRSAEVLRALIPGCRKTLLPGLRHGEFSLNRPEQYVRAVRELIGG